MDNPNNKLLKPLFVAMALTILLAFWLNRKSTPPPAAAGSDAEPPHIKAGMNPQRMANSRSLKESMERSLTGRGPTVPVLPPSLDEMLQDPETRKRHDEHQQVMNYLKSPARDTQECQEMLRILRENGYGIAELRPVYRRVWEIRTVDPEYSDIRGSDGRTTDKNNPQGLESRKSFAAEMANIFFEELKRGADSVPITNEVMIRSLFEIRPQVAYGEKLSYKVDNDLNTWLREADLEQLTQTARDNPNAFPDAPEKATPPAP